MRNGFKGKLWTQAEGSGDPDRKWAADNGLAVQTGSHGNGLGKGVMHYGNNSGYQAINLAFLFGATKIILLGYDMCVSQDGRRHFFGDHPKEIHANSDYREWVPRFEALGKDLESEGVEVINCSRRTALTAFKRGEL